jgi:ABC-type iron transport system FetAB ATPase subunit
LTNPQSSGIINTGGANMSILPRYEEAIIPIEKFLKYSLNPEVQQDKAIAFNQALGYNMNNAEKLIDNIKNNLANFPVTIKGDSGHGMKYEIIMNIIGENGKTANILTAWIDDNENGEMRLTSAYVDKKKGGNDD